jgi:mercuric ion binding protein
MKSLVIIIISLLSVHTAFSQMDLVTAQVDGLGCVFCANGLDKTFKDLKTKKQFNIDLEKGIMSFQMPSDAKITPQDIISRVDKAGYTVKSIVIQQSNGKEIVWNAASSKSAEKQEAKYTEAIIGVSGNCGMCKTRIEAAVNELDGIFFAFWNQKTQKLHVRFDESKLDQVDIELKVADIGHDTDNVKADDEVYSKLHSCCLYERQ